MTDSKVGACEQGQRLSVMAQLPEQERRQTKQLELEMAQQLVAWRLIDLWLP